MVDHRPHPPSRATTTRPVSRLRDVTVDAVESKRYRVEMEVDCLCLRLCLAVCPSSQGERECRTHDHDIENELTRGPREEGV